MGPVIELCGRCGFDIPVDADGCPGCAPQDQEPSRAARQVAGLALPTRSVHELPATPPRRERPAPSIGPAEGARGAFGYTVLLVVITLVLATLGWAARLDRFVLAVPGGTAERLDDLTVVATWASIGGLTVGLLAVLAWSVRRIAVGLARRHQRRDVLV